MTRYVDRPESEVRLVLAGPTGAYRIETVAGSLYLDASSKLDGLILDALAKAGVIGVAVDRPSEDDVAEIMEKVARDSEPNGTTFWVPTPHQRKMARAWLATRDVDPEPTVPVAEVRRWMQEVGFAPARFTEFDRRFGGS